MAMCFGNGKSEAKPVELSLQTAERMSEEQWPWWRNWKFLSIHPVIEWRVTKHHQRQKARPNHSVR